MLFFMNKSVKMARKNTEIPDLNEYIKFNEKDRINVCRDCFNENKSIISEVLHNKHEKRDNCDMSTMYILQ